LNIAHVYQDGGMRFYESHAAQLHIYHTIRGLQQAGHTVSLLALQGRQVLHTQDLGIFTSAQRHGCHYAEPGLAGTIFFKGFESAVRRLQSELRLPYLALFDSYRTAEAGIRRLRGIDLIHERFNLLALGGTWASKKLGIPLVLEVNADLIEQRKYKRVPERGVRRLFAIWATRLTFEGAAQIVCISESLRDHLRDKWLLSPHKLSVLPCAADVEAFAPQQGMALARRRLELSNDPVVVWVGGFYPWHDLDLLLDSFAQVLQKQPNAKLVLAGDGPTQSSVLRAVLRNGLRHAVIMTGAIPYLQVPELLSIADIAVVPSSPVTANQGGTGTPLKLFEYMAASKAIVASATEQATQVIRHGETGLLVEPGNSSAFAQAILRLLNDSRERARLGQRARQEAVENHSWTAYTQRLETIYEGILRAAPSAASSN
jgi:glycosyltransferase involved in cell wall biosynthesis